MSISNSNMKMWNLKTDEINDYSLQEFAQSHSYIRKCWSDIWPCKKSQILLTHKQIGGIFFSWQSHLVIYFTWQFL